MIQIDKTSCTGCGDCIEGCSQKAISNDRGRPVINRQLCTGCGICVSICPTGAIHELVPFLTRLREGGEKMYYGYGRGLGFRGSSPPWPYVGRGRGGLPRCSYYFGNRAMMPFAAPGTTREQEIDLLKSQAESIKKELDAVEARIRDLEVSK